MKKLIVLFITSLGFLSCTKGLRVDNIPMYGQPDIVRADIGIKADKEFINKVKNKLGDLNKASSMWALQGDKYFSERNYDFAMRRYNQSWLLNPNNYQSYWGFGRVMMMFGDFEKSIEYFKTSLSLVNDDYQKVSLLADYGASLSYAAKNHKDKLESSNLYNLAIIKFKESTVLDPEYGKAWRQWAFALYQQKKYDESRKKLKIAKSLGEPYPMLDGWLKSKKK